MSADGCGRQALGTLRSHLENIEHINQISRLLHNGATPSSVLGHPSGDVAVKAVASREKAAVLPFDERFPAGLPPIDMPHRCCQSCVGWVDRKLCRYYRQKQQDLHGLYPRVPCRRSVVSLTAEAPYGSILLGTCPCSSVDPEMRTRSSVLT